MEESGGWVWIHTGWSRAINLHHVTDIAFEEGEVLRAHLCGPALDLAAFGVPMQHVTLEGTEAEALRAYLARHARHVTD